MDDEESANTPALPGSAPRGSRKRQHSQDGPRKQRTSLSYNDTEWNIIVQAAALDELRPGAFVSRVALDAARMRVRGVLLNRGVLGKLYEALNQHNDQLARIGRNLNQVARHANSTQEVESVREQALAVLRLVRWRVIDSRNLLAELRYALR